MRYDMFSKIFIDQLEEKLKKEDVSFCRHSMLKTNVCRDGISVIFPESNISPTIYIDEKFEQYHAGKSMNTIVNDAARLICMLRNHLPETPEINRENAEKNLYCSVINADMNAELLADIPHKRFYDLALIAKYKVDDDSNILVRNDLCKYLHMTPDEVLEKAQKNTESEGYNLARMDEMIQLTLDELDFPEKYSIEQGAQITEECPLYILSNDRQLDGAVAIASKTALCNAYEKLQDNYYVLPSSRHELILMPERKMNGLTPENLREMVGEVNRSVVNTEDLLSDQVYFFNGRTLSIVDDKIQDKCFEMDLGKSKGKTR